MASDMVERVAAALVAAINATAQDWTKQYGRIESDDLARAAIAAMREPTDAMMTAALFATAERTPNTPMNRYRAAWAAMIDAALKFDRLPARGGIADALP